MEKIILNILTQRNLLEKIIDLLVLIIGQLVKSISNTEIFILLHLLLKKLKEEKFLN